MKEDWIECRADEFGELIRGITYDKTQASDIPKIDYLPILRANNINDNKLNFDELKYVDSRLINEIQKIIPNDIVIAMSSGSKHLVGKSAQSKIHYNGSFGAFCSVFRPNELLSGKYISYFFQSNEFRKNISETSKGSNINNLKREHILDFIFPLAPLPIQRAIVSKIEALFSDLDNGIANFKKAQEQLKVYRQAVLKKAFEGGFSSITNYELRITNEVNQDNHTNQKNHSADNLPKGWKWVKLGEIGKIKGGKRLPPKHSYAENNTGYLYIMAGNLKDGTVKHKRTYINKETFDILSNYKVIGSEVYITIVGACIGDAGIIPENIGNAILTENAAKIIELKSIDNKFLALWLNSIDCQTEIKNNILSATLGKLALSRIATLSVPLPPTLEEQTQIVQEIESRLSVCDKMEQSIAESIEKAEALRQSILKKAFEGKLLSEAEIAQCKAAADYEPAGELLKKIQAEKLAKEQEKKKSTIKKKSKQ